MLKRLRNLVGITKSVSTKAGRKLWVLPFGHRAELCRLKHKVDK